MSMSEFGVTTEPPAQRPRPASPQVRRKPEQPPAPARRAPPVRQPQAWSGSEPAWDAKPWWFSIPAVVKGCFKVVFFPVTLAIIVSELVMAALILGVAGVAAGWWLGFLTDAQIIEVARPVGERILAMVQSLGYL